jgi:tetratricopeptide (TPR) repeat protein
MRATIIICWVIICVGCGTTTPVLRQNQTDAKNSVVHTSSPVDRADFDRGYTAYEKKKFAKARLFFFRYLKHHTPDDADYEWAQFFFGICLKRTGFSHASVDMLANLVTRKPNPKIVSYSLELLEEVTRTLPFDREKVIFQALSDQSYGFVDQHLSDFINYHQGVFDWRHGFIEWGNLHFNTIQPNTYYFYRYRYHQARYHVYQGEIETAIKILASLLAQPIGDSTLRDDVRQTLARLYYEVGEFAIADQLYREIETPIINQAHHLLERAWVHYRMGRPETAMGYLYAFRAPAFQSYFSPEYYILKSFIYKSVCHYEKALQVIKEFDRHYGTALNAIHSRARIKNNPTLLRVIFNQEPIKAAWEFLARLEQEHQQVAAIADPELRNYLDQIYTLQIKKTKSDFRKSVQTAYEEMADDLLKYEEESHLVAYEIGLDMVQRVQQYHYRDQNSDASPQNRERAIVYPFQGEFWSHELDDYQVTLVDKCQCAEEWDVFFK